MSSRRVAVLMGGMSAEREVSLRSGQAVCAALQRCGHQVTAVDVRSLADVYHVRADVVFIALHGTYGEDGCVQGVLEMRQLPYTGCGVLASALCMDKRMCKRLLQQQGISVPTEIPLTAAGPVRYPVLLKPVQEGSSVGLHWLHQASDWQALELEPSRFDDWLAEMPVRGVEIAVSVLNGEALPPVEIVAHSGCYDYHAKYTAGATDYYTPARLPAETLRYCMQQAEKAVHATACRGAPRVDMIVSNGGEAVVLEINTLPGMTTTSLLPKAAAAAGLDFDALCQQLLDSAALDHDTAGRAEVMHGTD